MEKISNYYRRIQTRVICVKGRVLNTNFPPILCDYNFLLFSNLYCIMYSNDTTKITTQYTNQQHLLRFWIVNSKNKSCFFQCIYKFHCFEPSADRCVWIAVLTCYISCTPGNGWNFSLKFWICVGFEIKLLSPIILRV
jgi:hypothetical protein